MPLSLRILGPSLVALCFVLYKIIAKILTARLQNVVDHLIDPAQSGFIPGRQICDNILLATDLIRGYNWANASPRCMLEIDIFLLDMLGSYYLQRGLVFRIA